jgi:hypothetical protein
MRTIAVFGPDSWPAAAATNRTAARP